MSLKDDKTKAADKDAIEKASGDSRLLASGYWDVCFWHKADIETALTNVRFWGHARLNSQEPIAGSNGGRRRERHRHSPNLALVPDTFPKSAGDSCVADLQSKIQINTNVHSGVKHSFSHGALSLKGKTGVVKRCHQNNPKTMSWSRTNFALT